jgi:hypothetical protein
MHEDFERGGEGGYPVETSVELKNRGETLC